MKILHVVQGYFPAIGGTERLVQQLSEELVRSYGDEVTVFTTDRFNGEGLNHVRTPHMPVGFDLIKGVRVRRFPVQVGTSQVLRWGVSALRKAHIAQPEAMRVYSQGPIIPGLGAAICHQPADVIMAASFPLLHMFEAIKAARKSQRPCVFTGCLHPDDGWGFQRKMIYQAIPQADFYVALSPYEETYVALRGADPSKVKAIGVGIHPASYEGIPVEAARQRLGVHPGEPLIGYIGQLVPHKGVDILLQAMPAVWQVKPETRLLIAGSKVIFAHKIEEMIAAFTPEQRQKVILRYNFSEEEKPWLYAALDVFCYPSGFESFGIAYLEAWSVGKPVISTFRGAIPTVVSALQDGLLVPYQKPLRLAEAILLLLQNPAWAQTLGENGRRKVYTRYTWPKVAAEYRQVYQSVMS